MSSFCNLSFCRAEDPAIFSICDHIWLKVEGSALRLLAPAPPREIESAARPKAPHMAAYLVESCAPDIDILKKIWYNIKKTLFFFFFLKRCRLDNKKIFWYNIKKTHFFRALTFAQTKHLFNSRSQDKKWICHAQKFSKSFPYFYKEYPHNFLQFSRSLENSKRRKRKVRFSLLI